MKKFLSTLSARTRYKISNQLASLLYNYINIRKNQAKTNLKKAFPYWSDRKIRFTLKKMYQFFSFNFIQFISVPKSWERLEIEVIGRDILDSNLEKGRGVIFITGHFGAWEILGKWLAILYLDLAGILDRNFLKSNNK